ncbi:MAG: Appr-1-p processing protein [Blastopirellula sp.]|nr:MAG: Appr-1-p processing protein [Blastopirellula sp.]
MNVKIHIGDVLDQAADVLISTANPWLNLSGGVNGAILARVGESIQAELHAYLKSKGLTAVPAGTVIQTSAGSLPFNHILHAVAIDPFYDSSIQLVEQTLTTAFELAVSLGAKTIATPTLATGYGPLTIESFAQALQKVTQENQFDLDTISVVVLSNENADIVKKVLFAETDVNSQGVQP